MLTELQHKVLLQSALFRKITQAELINILPCLKITLKTYEMNDIILTQGTIVNYIYIILEGQVEISKENFAGQKVLFPFYLLVRFLVRVLFVQKNVFHLF